MTERIQSVDRAVDLLLAVAAAGPAVATVPALARVCDLNRATAWRLLKTLQARGLVTTDAAGRYSLGPTTVGLGQVAGPDSLVAAARPVLERTAALTGETAALAMPGAAGLTYVDEATPAAVLAAGWLGRSVAVHATSTGKAYLAYLADDEQETVLPRRLERYTATTVTDRRTLGEQLAAVRRDGYAVCVGELEESLFGASAPVLSEQGRPVAIVSVWGTEHRLPRVRR